MTDARRVREYFDGIAGGYRRDRYGPGADPWRDYFFSGRLRAAADRLGPSPGRVLDLGSGPGVLRDAVAAAGGTLFSLDLSAAMLRGAGPRAVVADAVRIPFIDGAFDTVLALGLTTYVADLPGLLAEATRVLRPGGRLLVTFTRRASLDTMLRAAYRATLGRLTRGRGVLESGLAIRPVSDREAARALIRAGLRPRARHTLNLTVFPFAYLFRSASLALARRLEAGGRLAGAGSDLLLVATKRPAPATAARRPRRRRVHRVIARLNVGGPALQAILLTTRLDPSRFESRLITGLVGPDEGDLLPAAREAGADPTVLPGLGRAPSPLDDLRALLELFAIFLRERPSIVHTHTAKAGALGRVAAFLAGVPVRFHTFHGHVLHGYFGPRASAAVRAAERVLARLSTGVIAVSEEVAEDLAVRHRVVPRSRIRVVPLGLSLAPFLEAPRRGGGVREELGLSPDSLLLIWAGRLTAVKEPELLVRAFRRIAGAEPRAYLLVAGDGDLRGAAEGAARHAGVAERIRFLGWRHDLPRLFADGDLALLTSRNEGTPVALIEAAATGLPAVSTRVGGVPAVVADGKTGRLVPPNDEAAFATAVLELLADPALREEMGQRARERVRERFSAERLLADLEGLYSAYSG